MTRLDFFVALRSGLKKLPPQELESAVRYYTEYFDDAGEENEQKVLEELGDPEKIAKQITAEYMVRDISVYKAPEKSQTKKDLNSFWVAILALFAAPIALPIAIAIAAVALALGLAAACVLLAFFLSAISLVICGVVVALFGFFLFGVHFPTGLCGVGAGLLIAGLGLLLLVPTIYLSRVTFSGIAKIISNRVVRRKAV